MAKILFIEDDEGVRKYIGRIIDMAGHECVTAEEGGKGYELAADESFELILTDLSMPGDPNEMELVRKLRERRPEVPIVVCSGYPTQERIEECEQLGITEFLTKPFEVSFIRSVLDRLLNTNADTTSKEVGQHDS